jgi:hypothetical protein
MMRRRRAGIAGGVSHQAVGWAVLPAQPEKEWLWAKKRHRE